MKAAILFYESSGKLSYGHHLLTFIQQALPAVTCLDLDDASKSELFSYAEKLALEAEKFVLILDTPGTSRISGLIETAISKKDRASILFTRSNPICQRLEKIMMPETVQFVSGENEQKIFLKNALKDQ